MTETANQNPVSLEDPAQISDFLDLELSQLRKALDALDPDSLFAARNLIVAAKNQGGRVHVTGIGKPGHLAGYIASLLSSTGTPAYVLDGTECVHGSSGQVCSGDVVIAISNSGETDEMKRTVTTLNNNKAHVIGLSRSKDSWLSKNSEIPLVCGVEFEGDSLNKPPRASILAEMVTLQILSILLQNEAGLTMEQYGRWHPGGSLGKAVRKELGDGTV